MRTNAQGLQIIKDSEGLRLHAYRCPAGVWTIGYGDTGPDVTPGLTITEDEAEARLRARLETEFEPGVERMLRVPVSGNQFSALVSFAYNVGLRALWESSLLRLLGAGDTQGAAAQFGRWTKSGGRVLPGLVKRRQAEAELFLAPGDGDPA